MNLVELLLQARSEGASDVHCTQGAPVMFRIDGELLPKGHIPSMSEIYDVARVAMGESRWNTFKEVKEFDFAFDLGMDGRCRVNVFRQNHTISLAIRLIPSVLPLFDELHLPLILKSLIEVQDGLILITGPAGSGKSTTVSALVNHLNRTRRCHIVTIEDPIEFVYRYEMALIEQREIGSDTQSHQQALQSALRQDPDVIVVGEMRDVETIRAVLWAALTGHLVIATVHATNTVQAIERVVESFPPEAQGQIRMDLAFSLRGVSAQRLYPAKAGGRMPTVEVLVNTTAVANLIRNAKSHQIMTAMQTGKMQGMQTMEDELHRLVAEGKVESVPSPIYLT